jgi:hypothetical protein
MQMYLNTAGHHKHKGLDHFIRSASRVIAALAVSHAVQLIFFFVACSCMILEGFGFVEFFVCVKASGLARILAQYINLNLMKLCHKNWPT